MLQALHPEYVYVNDLFASVETVCRRERTQQLELEYICQPCLELINLIRTCIIYIYIKNNNAGCIQWLPGGCGTWLSPATHVSFISFVNIFYIFQLLCCIAIHN